MKRFGMRPSVFSNSLKAALACLPALVLFVGGVTSSVQAATMTVTATKMTDSSGALVTTPATFSISQAQKVFWTASYTGGPTDGHGFYLSTPPADNNEYTLTSSGAQSGSYLLQPGNYQISIKYFGMGPGTYSVKYDPTGNGSSNGDPHITTVNGIHYDFQGAGEFIALRGKGFEMQVRQTPVPTASSQPDPHTGLTSAVALNTAVAVRLGSHRVSLQYDKGDQLPQSKLTLRIDGAITTIAVASGGIKPSPGSRIQLGYDDLYQLNFPDGTVLVVAPSWWEPAQRWYLDIAVENTPANQGLMGIIAGRNWLPDLPNGHPMGFRPTSMAQRYHDLYGRFAQAWRVTPATSLFDYGPGESPSTFALLSWPKMRAPFSLPGHTLVKGTGLVQAVKACSTISDPELNRECRFDVAVMGDPGLAASYSRLQDARIRRGIKD